MDLLAIVAHPDDAEIFCGGTLAKHAARGDDVTIAYMTRGEFGGFDTTQAEVAETREAEARAAANVLGADVTFLDHRDGRITYSLEHRLEIVDLLREYDPDLVLTHFADDMHPDHRTTSRLVTDAYYMASLPLLETAAEPTDPDNVYYFGKPTSSFEPTVIVDVSEFQETKEEAALCHESQVAWLEEHGGVDAEFSDFVESMRATGHTLGRQAGATYAEGFTQLHETSVEYLE
ncbi:PIG-L family deacetylase [Halobacteria archaeon AArc-m2/3/4]|uniref:PIG-L family deacetylase n=1 Tax=Natronoglomus mannanivorans TaxID=2979990 RepID=A0ABT2QFU0_9EURY|nr:PIG-L family deacetylase [Halobacteria archaeon AArc-m2/3/4]